MKYELTKEKISYLNILEQSLYNRNVKINDLEAFFKPSEEYFLNPETLGLEILKSSYMALKKAIKNKKRIGILVDADCDGYCSSALIYNYLYEQYGKLDIKVIWHSTKAHGLSDTFEEFFDCDLVLIPDAGSNDIKEHKILYDRNIDIIIMDHHKAEIEPVGYKYANILNNQLSNYKNKDMCGTGITWEFCRFIDKEENTSYANNYIDLVAIACISDMMELSTLETENMVQLGLTNINNDFINELILSNSYSIKGSLNPRGVGFYIAPLINAVTRVGTQEEKELVLKALFVDTCNEEIPTKKRGHKGELIKLSTEAARICGNIKSRQDSSIERALKKIQEKIENQKNNSVILLLFDKGEIDGGIAGVICNKAKTKYQKSVCMLTLQEDNYYRGSARGCEAKGVYNFRKDCEESNLVEYAQGHNSAFGLSIPKENILNFTQYMNKKYKDLEKNIIYYVDDIIEDYNTLDSEIKELSKINNYFVDRPLIALKNLCITQDMIEIRGLEKNKPTLIIHIINDVDLIKFNVTEEEIKKLTPNNYGYTEIDIVGECYMSEFGSNITPTIEVKDYEIKTVGKFLF